MPIPEDTFTTTVSAAAAYEAYRSQDDYYPEDDLDYDRYEAQQDADLEAREWDEECEDWDEGWDDVDGF